MAGGRRRRAQPSDHRRRHRRDRGDRRRSVLLDPVGQLRGSAQTGTTTHHTTTHKTTAPKLVAQPAQFQAGVLQSVAPFDGHAWALNHAKPTSVVDLDDPSATPIVVGKGTFNLGSGDGALWVSGKAPNGGRIRKVSPGGSPAVGPSILYPHQPTSARAVESGGTIWQPVIGGVLKISEQGGAPVPVKGLHFTPDSIELVGGAIWASGKNQLAQVPVTTPQPQATVVKLPGAGWITGDATSVYVVDATGVVSVNPSDPTTQTPVAGITAPPIRIDLANGILWTVFYSAPSAGTRVGTLGGVDVAHAGAHPVTPVTFKAPAKGYITKLVPVNNTFWLTVVGPGGQPGLEPFSFGG